MRAPWDESCSPVPATTSRALRGAAHQSLHGIADGSWDCFFFLQQNESVSAVASQTVTSSW